MRESLYPLLLGGGCLGWLGGFLYFSYLEYKLDDRTGEILKKFPKKRFLLLLSSKEESQHFGVDKDNTFVVCPSISLFNEIVGDIAPQLTEYKTIIEKERLKLIKDTESDKLNIFSSFNCKKC